MIFYAILVRVHEAGALCVMACNLSTRGSPMRPRALQTWFMSSNFSPPQGYDASLLSHSGAHQCSKRACEVQGLGAASRKGIHAVFQQAIGQAKEGDVSDAETAALPRSKP